MLNLQDSVQERKTGTLPSTVRFSGVKGRIRVLSVFFLTSVAGHQGSAIDFWMGDRKEDKNGGLLVSP